MQTGEAATLGRTTHVAPVHTSIKAAVTVTPATNRSCEYSVATGGTANIDQLCTGRSASSGTGRSTGSNA